MKFGISRSLRGDLMVRLEPESDHDRDTLEAIYGMKHEEVSVYAETGSLIYGATAREDGQVLIGPDGEPPSVIINLFGG